MRILSLRLLLILAYAIDVINLINWPILASMTVNNILLLLLLPPPPPSMLTVFDTQSRYPLQPTKANFTFYTGLHLTSAEQKSNSKPLQNESLSTTASEDYLQPSDPRHKMVCTVSKCMSLNAFEWSIQLKLLEVIITVS